MRAPSEVYEVSSREWRARPKAPEYPGHWDVRRVRTTGDIRLAGSLVFLCEALQGETVGLAEVDDGVWRLSYRRSVLCFIDARGEAPRILSGKPEGQEDEPCDG